jgi:hypothetical protein
MPLPICDVWVGSIEGDVVVDILLGSLEGALAALPLELGIIIGGGPTGYDKDTVGNHPGRAPVAYELGYCWPGLEELAQARSGS